MEIQLRHTPSFSVARLLLAGNEPVTVQGGALMAYSAAMTVDANTNGGVLAGLKRSVLSGESFFVSTVTAPPQGGWADVVGTLPGDIIALPITAGRDQFITRGSWVANSYGVSTETKWAGARNLIGGEGGFGLRAFGEGQALVSVYGALDVMDLGPGEQVIIDTGHVVSYDMGMSVELRQSSSSLWRTVKSGEGFVFLFTGPGRVLLQSRNPRDLNAYITSHSANS